MSMEGVEIRIADVAVKNDLAKVARLSAVLIGVEPDAKRAIHDRAVAPQGGRRSVLKTEA